MATQTPETPPLSASIARLLASVRGRIRRYVWLETLAIVVAALGAIFWLTLVLDQPWALELPRAGRLVVLAAVTLLVVWLVVRFLILRLTTPLSDRSMALLVERRFPGLRDSLLTSVEMAGTEPADEFTRDMLAHTFAEADARVPEVRVGEIFNTPRLTKLIALALLAVVSVGAFAALAPSAFGVWMRRNMLLSNEIWPRQTELIVDGFVNGRAKIARGSEFVLVARANLQKLVPEVVQIRTRTDDGGRERRNMRREGNAQPGVDEYQNFTDTLTSVLTPMTLDVIGGDARIRGLRLEVVDSPTISRMALRCVFPDYMQRSPRELPVTGAMQLPEGVKVVVTGEFNKPMVELTVQSTTRDAAPVETVLGGTGQAPMSTFEFELGELREDRALVFHMLDVDQIRNRDPIRLAISLAPDEPPQVAAQLRGISSAVTPQARIPVSGELLDDYGLGRAWFDYTVDPAKESEVAGQQALAGTVANLVKFTLTPEGEQALDLRDQLRDAMGERLTLKPGQALQLQIKASDTYPFQESPHETGSQRFLLEVVTPDQLRTLLESRELSLRQRFETIIGEMTETGDTLAGLEFAGGEVPAAIPPEGAPPEAKPAAGEAAAPAGEDPLGASEARKLRIERGLQNSRKNGQETLGVAVGFEEITVELVNNRVDTEELKSRLMNRIARPLRDLAEQEFPELDRRLEELRKVANSAAEGGAARDRARQQTELILNEMRQVLNQMLELETFNEALTLLRGIIEDQEAISTATGELRKKKAAALLEGEDE